MLCLSLCVLHVLCFINLFRILYQCWAVQVGRFMLAWVKPVLLLAPISSLAEACQCCYPLSELFSVLHEVSQKSVGIAASSRKHINCHQCNRVWQQPVSPYATHRGVIQSLAEAYQSICYPQKFCQGYVESGSILSVHMLPADVLSVLCGVWQQPVSPYVTPSPS